MAKAEGILIPQRIELLVFALALGVRAIYLAAVYAGPESLMHVDSAMWLALAADPSRWLGTSERLPVYPTYLGVMAMLFGPEPIKAIIGQIIVDCFTCVLVMRAAGALAPPDLPKAGIAAGIVAALNPTQFVMSAVLLGDTLFVFAVAGALLSAIRWHRSMALSQAVATAAWACLAFQNRAMIAPVQLALPAAFGAFMYWRGARGVAVLRTVAIVGLIGAGCIGTAMLRNWVEFGRISITSQTGYHTAFWIVPLVQEAKDGMPVERTQAELAADYEKGFRPEDGKDPFTMADRWMGLARERMAGLGLPAFAKAWVFGAAINVASPGVLMSPPLMHLPRTGFYATPGATFVDKMMNFLLYNDNATYARWLALGTLLEIPFKLLAFAGLAYALARPSMRVAAVAMAGWIAFVLVISGPVASPKYRLPLEPVFSIFAGLVVARAFRATEIPRSAAA